MARRRDSAANRESDAARLIRWPLLLLAGVGVGLLLGEFAAGRRTPAYSSEPGSFSRLSANPDAMVAQGEGTAPCLDCPDSHAIGVRIPSIRDDRMGAEFRELGAIEPDPPRPNADIDDDYNYGGRFPDPEPGEWNDMPSDGESASTGAGDGPPPADDLPPLPPPEF